MATPNHTAASIVDRPDFLRSVLLVDAATCVATGLLMTLATAPLSNLTQLPGSLVKLAGLILFPTALFMAVVATRRPLWRTGVWMVILGNVAWVAGSLLVLGIVSTSGLGMAFVLAQAVVVAALAALERAGLQRLPASA